MKVIRFQWKSRRQHPTDTRIFNLHPRVGQAIDSMIDNNLIAVIVKGDLKMVRLAGIRQWVNRIFVEPNFLRMLKFLHILFFSPRKCCNCSVSRQSRNQSLQGEPKGSQLLSDFRGDLQWGQLGHCLVRRDATTGPGPTPAYCTVGHVCV